MKVKPAFYLITFILILSIQMMGQKIDTIYHINGNVMTGDFKKLNYGVVTWKMDGMGTISMEEPKINTIKSSKQFEVKMKNGLIYFGSFDTSGFDRKVNVVIANGKELINIDEIVEVYPIKRNFWMRTSGNFSLGLNYTKGSNLATISFAGNINYRKRKSSFDLSWDDYNTIQSDTIRTTKADGNFGWERQLRNKWSLGTMVGLSQNSELGTKLRLDFTVVGLYDFIYNKWNRFYGAAGVSVQRETPYDDSGITNDIVGLVAIAWKVYKYTTPKIWVDADITFIPYFTTANRYRTNLNLNPKVGIFSNDLKIGFKIYYTYDNKPPSVNASSNDWGINLEITYSFH